MPRDTFLDFILDKLAPLGDVHAKKMFGGVGLYQRAIFFGIVYDGRLYFKTDAKTRAAYIAEGMQPFQPSPKTTLKNYYELPAGIIDNRNRLVEWATAAIRVAKA